MKLFHWTGALWRRAPPAVLLALAGLLAFPLAVRAHGDHDTPAAAAAPGAPRVQTHSDLFELVGIVEGGTMTLYLDRYATNEPVPGATIEIEATPSGIAGAGVRQARAQARPDGTYVWEEPLLQRHGDWALTFTVRAGSDADLLSGELSTGTEHADEEAAGGFSPTRLAAWAAAAVLVGAGVLLLARRRRRMRQVPVAALAAVLLLPGALQPLPALAHGDHDQPAAASAGNAPRRQSDGSVFLPKPGQRQLDVRTQLASRTEVARTLELNGRVVMDPSAGGRLQSVQGGRVEPPHGESLPRLGQAVQRGQVLAIVRPAVAPIEQANQAAAAAEARINLDNARKRLARLEQLEGTVPQRDVDAAKAEVASLEARSSLSRGSLTAVETLVSPVSGVVAALNVVAGQVVASNDVVLEIVDPQRLVVEALAYDAAAVASLERDAATSVGGAPVPLVLQGVGRQLREQALPLQFRVLPGPGVPVLALGQPVVVKARSSQRLQAVVLPAAAVVKNPSNQDIVWVHVGAEVFQPRVVSWQPVNGATVAVTQGLADGDRVVVRGASLVNQVR